jgi:hypothetical protein
MLTINRLATAIFLNTALPPSPALGTPRAKFNYDVILGASDEDVRRKIPAPAGKDLNAGIRHLHFPIS